MKALSVRTLFLAAVLACASLAAADADMAMALATSAEKMHEGGKREEARTMCYRALANDKNCPQALYLMARLLEEDGQEVAAGMFYERAARELSKAAVEQKHLQNKARDASIGMRRLNPFASLMQREMEKYTFELAKIAERSPDSLTADATYTRAQTLNLAHYVAPEKMPVFAKSGPAVAAPTPPADPFRRSRPEEPVTATQLTPEIERALKQSGWDTISGSWKKVNTNVYEVTDGRLEANKTNGFASVIVHRSADGQVSLFCRNNKQSEAEVAEMRRFPGYSSSFGGSASGFGALVKGNKVDIYAPSEMWTMGGGSNWEPYKAHTSPMPDGYPKDAIVVSVAKNNLEIQVNGKKEKKTSYQISESGPFVLIVKGTKTIELPQVRGQ